jgi:prolyl-tRNA synthetase
VQIQEEKRKMAESPITPREKDFAAWYQDVVLQGDMVEPAEIVKGCMVIKPNGYAVWEVLQRELDARFKATGHQNIYLPLRQICGASATISG